MTTNIGDPDILIYDFVWSPCGIGLRGFNFRVDDFNAKMHFG